MTLDQTLNEMEGRLTSVERRAMRPVNGSADVSVDVETGETITQEQVNFELTEGVTPNWESWTQVTPLIEDPDDEWGYSGGESTTPYGMVEAHLIGSMCMLTGLVRRKNRVGNKTLAAGKRHNEPMFELPVEWRPMSNIILPCIVGNSDPASATTKTFGTAWIEVRPDVDPVRRSAGRVYLVATSIAIAPQTGWVALQGVFPCYFLPDDDDDTVPTPDSWDDQSDTLMWNDVDDTTTWDSFPSPA